MSAEVWGYARKCGDVWENVGICAKKYAKVCESMRKYAKVCESMGELSESVGECVRKCLRKYGDTCENVGKCGNMRESMEQQRWDIFYIFRISCWYYFPHAPVALLSSTYESSHRFRCKPSKYFYKLYASVGEGDLLQRY
jgi:hypothetical protein